MRPPAIEKCGFYETSQTVAQLLTKYFKPAESGRLLDPCAGEGTAASILAKAFNCQSWGAELSPALAALAAEKMDRLFNTPWSSCHLTSESITLLFLNPPYSHDRLGDQKRLELEFLKSTTPKLIRGGVLIYIVPHPLLRDLDVASHLAGYYENIRIYRYPDTGFNQVIVLATKRVKYKIPSHEEVHQVQAWADVEPPMLVEVDEPLYELLPAIDKGSGGQPIRFSRLDWQPEEIVDATQKRGLHSSKEWLDLLNLSRGLGELKQPVMPLKKGHIAMLMASGMMGTLRLTDEDGKPMLVKGRVVKVTEKVEENTDKKGHVTSEIFRDRFVSTVAILRQSGIEIIDTVDPLSKFMHKYGDQIGAHILSAYRPLYNFDPTSEETAVLDTLGTKRKPLPGQEKAGLLPAQRHAATAIARSIRKNGVGNIQGEMGLGKTLLGTATLELLNAYPAIVLCPPHLVPKWIREIEETIPGSKAMEITRIGRNANDPGDVNDVRRFLQLYKNGELGKKPVAVIAHTSAKYGAGWEHAVIRKKFVDDEDGRVFEALCCPTCGSPIQIDLPGGFVKVSTTFDDLGDKRRFCEAEISGYELDDHKRLVRDEHGNPVWGKRKCGTPLFQFTGHRWAIADYIAKHAKGEFKLLIADELHQFAAKASDRGVAFHQLVEATKYALTLTGTFFGGKSTSIFWLLHRLNAGVRKDFAFNDEKRWARLYGVLEMTRKSKRAEEDVDEDGFTGNRRYQNQAKEKPGISPAIVNRLLDTTIFLSLKDLGLAMPHYAEEVVTLEMTDEQSSQYRVMAKKLYDLAIKNRRYLSTWLQWTLARPNSAFRDEVVEVDEVNQKGEVVRRKQLMELPAVVSHESMPKESWLVDFCRTERQQGRKVLIYLRQTGTRDIQDRILKVLREGGVRAEVLTSGVNPRKREEWIAKRVVGLDALVVNPRLVETGLDLIAFSSVVFGEIEYSLYTLWQAVRRVWRLGQTKPVKAIFSVYGEAMEARALALMGQKMKAAQLLYGDEVGGAIVPEEDGDILMKLAREALESADLPDLQSLFADEVVVSNSPMGCPTVPSAPLPVPEIPKTVSWSDWMTNKGVVGRAASRVRSRQVTQNQVSLF
ncbi:MAG: DEAD/DEAH box helicase [Chloroflexi bacterium]|nr:DEAD/DEAH box helicase [Chloroflexota bacterium]